MPRIFAALAAALLFILTAGPLSAKDIKGGSLEITGLWTRATPAGAKVAGGFVTIKNTGGTPDRLIGGSFAHAGRVEIHEMAVVNDIMRMRELPNGLEIKPGQTVVLKPGSYHLMFMGLKQQLKEGGAIKGTLKFEKAGVVDVVYKVGKLGQKMNMQHGAGKMKHQ